MGTEFLENIVAISGGYCHVLALDGEGNVWAWGLNATGNGQLGDGLGWERYTPIHVRKIGEGRGFLTDIFYIDAGYAHSLAIDKKGNFWSWGWNH